jgi:bifunctional DNA-binding transcriptional regulator/antitoxin component of YhaV-PrlF toxin-antitoxin module
MAKVTSKLQVTLPKQLAEQYRIEPGSDIEWEAAGDVIRVLPPAVRRASLPIAERIDLFDQATSRQVARQRGSRLSKSAAGRGTKARRGWKREDLYDRGPTR